MNLLLFHTITQSTFPWTFKMMGVKDEASKIIALNASWIFSLFLNLTLVYSYPYLNLILYIDLEWIIVNPFYPQARRNQCYYLTTLACFVLGIVSCTLVYSIGADLSLQVVIFNCINMVFSTLSVLLLVRILYQLMRQGTSWELKKIIYQRYIILFVIFVPQYLRCFIAFFKFAGFLADTTPTTMYVFNCVETYPIVFIPLIRLYEPLII